mgnify:CR=1 FL=1
MEKFFKLKENGTTVKTEVVGGVTTFMAMAYILAVNPSILSASGMDPNAILTATALASFIGCMAMALMANYPFALAPGLGLNAFFAYTICGVMGYTWQFALTAVFLEGIIFIFGDGIWTFYGNWHPPVRLKEICPEHREDIFAFIFYQEDTRREYPWYILWALLC